MSRIVSVSPFNRALGLLKSATALAFFALISTGCEESRAGRNLSSTQEQRAKQIIASNRCGSCHTLQAQGLNLSGEIGPDLTHQARRGRQTKWLKNQLKNPHSVPDEEVTTGFEGRQKWMPRFDKLDEPDLEAVVHFLQSLK